LSLIKSRRIFKLSYTCNYDFVIKSAISLKNKLQYVEHDFNFSSKVDYTV